MQHRDASGALTRRTTTTEPNFGLAWIGVAALAVIGVSAVAYGRQHEVEHQQRNETRGAGNRVCPCCQQ